MPKIVKWNWDAVVAVSMMIITACGLFILMVSVFRLDEQAYQLLAIVGANSSVLGLIVIRQRKELQALREIASSVAPERREKIMADWKNADRKEAH